MSQCLTLPGPPKRRGPVPPPLGFWTLLGILVLCFCRAIRILPSHRIDIVRLANSLFVRSCHITTGLEPAPASLTTETKVRSAPKAAEDVADVVVRWDSLLKDTTPPVEDPTDDSHACIERVINCDLEAVLFRQGEMLPVRDPRWWTVKVGP